MLEDLCTTIFTGADGAVLSGGGGGGRGVEGTVQASKGGGGGALGVDQVRNSGTAHLYLKGYFRPQCLGLIKQSGVIIIEVKTRLLCALTNPYKYLC